MKGHKLLFKFNSQLRSIGRRQHLFTDIAFGLGCGKLLLLCVGKVGGYIVDTINHGKLACIVAFETVKRMVRGISAFAVAVAAYVGLAVYYLEAVACGWHLVEDYAAYYIIAPNAELWAEPPREVERDVPIRSPSALLQIGGIAFLCNYQRIK